MKKRLVVTHKGNTSVKFDYGKPIEGSVFYRDYCCGCGAPLRVYSSDVGTGIQCEECQPNVKGVGNGVTFKDDEDAFKPSWQSE